MQLAGVSYVAHGAVKAGPSALSNSELGVYRVRVSTIDWVASPSDMSEGAPSVPAPGAEVDLIIERSWAPVPGADVVLAVTQLPPGAAAAMGATSPVGLLALVAAPAGWGNGPQQHRELWNAAKKDGGAAASDAQVAARLVQDAKAWRQAQQADLGAAPQGMLGRVLTGVASPPGPAVPAKGSDQLPLGSDEQPSRKGGDGQPLRDREFIVQVPTTAPPVTYVAIAFPGTGQTPPFLVPPGQDYVHVVSAGPRSGPIEVRVWTGSDPAATYQVAGTVKVTGTPREAVLSVTRSSGGAYAVTLAATGETSVQEWIDSRRPAVVPGASEPTDGS